MRAITVKEMIAAILVPRRWGLDVRLRCEEVEIEKKRNFKCWSEVIDVSVIQGDS